MKPLAGLAILGVITVGVLFMVNSIGAVAAGGIAYTFEGTRYVVAATKC